MKEMTTGQKVGLFILAAFVQGLMAGDAIKVAFIALSTFTWGP